MSTAPGSEAAAELRVRWLRARDRAAAQALLAREPRLNLLIIEAVRRLGERPGPGEARAEVVGAFRGSEPVAVASLQPLVAVDARATPEAVEALLPWIGTVPLGLVKTLEERTGLLWQRLRAHGRRALLDRFEVAEVLEARGARLVDPPPGARVRRAVAADLPRLVEAARASLREESRPDPFEGDFEGFRRWVAGRSGRATLVDVGGRCVFVGYADVQCELGWLLQGVYTWPEWRRRGLAAAGVSALCRAAFGAGADHVQLAVVENNLPAERLYERLGFRPFARLRTVLFC